MCYASFCKVHTEKKKAHVVPYVVILKKIKKVTFSRVTIHGSMEQQSTIYLRNDERQEQ